VTEKIKIIFEDEWMVVVDKPAGTIVNDAKTTGKAITIQKWHGERIKIYDLRFTKNNEFLEKSGIVHRLDKDTSGLLVLAKTPEAYFKLKEQFLNRKVNKTYFALVHGKMKNEQGIVSLPIERNPKAWGKFMIGEDLSKTAITEYKRIKIYDSGFTSLEIHPLTGRTHQIRVHMKHLAHPVVSDPIYLSRRQLYQDLSWCPRLFLHAGGIELDHPVTGKKMKFESSLPVEMKLVLERLA
jgi:23S rRNA pseudouridine1911/1915/1917 synthase